MLIKRCGVSIVFLLLVAAPTPTTTSPLDRNSVVQELAEIDGHFDDLSEERCDNTELKEIVKSVLDSHNDNLEAARQIEQCATSKFGGRFNTIVSDHEFAFVNWYGKLNCVLVTDTHYTLTWQD